MVSETQPLLPSSSSPTTPVARRRAVKKRFGTPCTRLFSYIVVGFLFMLAFTLVFLPRTSLRRDLFRLHHIFVTDADVERILFESISENEIRSFAQEYTKSPHLAGQGWDQVNFTKSKFEEFGLNAEIVPYYTYLSYPLEHALSLVDTNGTILYQASLEEDVLEEDPTTGLKDRVPTFHGYAANGNVTAKFIYANYGRKQDFDKLVEKGIEIKGKIVIVRYDHLFRGLKVKFAQELGAVGVLIFTDPTDDGHVDFAHGYKPYPEGPARNPSSVQRGSVMFLSYAPGDPTTPGYASTKDAVRQDPKDAIPSIPSLPISYKEAIPILKSLNGLGLKASDLGDDWDGILTEEGVHYNVGPSDLELNLYNLQNFTTTPIHNVIATFDGVISDEVVIVGNHRDAWIAGGAGDPNSGTAVLLAFAKALGKLKEKGWRPFRTIILANWDGEEYALLGSTEWGEDKATFLGKKALAYINLDIAVSGSRFYAESSPSLNQVIRDVTALVPHPQHPQKSLYDVWEDTSGARIGTLGTGSDFTVFLDHLGIPSIDFGFNPGKNDAVYHYHSNYDSFHWMDNFCNDSWAFHVAATQTMGLLSITLAQHAVADLYFEDYAKVLSTGLENLLEEYGETFEFISTENYNDHYQQNYDHRDHYYDHEHNNNNNNNNDHENNHNNRNRDDRDNDHDHNNNRNNNRDNDNDRDQDRPPKTPHEAVKQLKHALKRFEEVAKRTDKYSKYLQTEFNTDYPWYHLHKKFVILVKIQIHNWKISTLERLFLFDEGLDNRPWFKHIFFAPDRYLGYGGAVFPGLLESLQDKKPLNFIRWASISTKALYKVIDTLRHY